MNVFTLAASLRDDSLNKKLGTVAHRIAEQEGHNADFRTLADFPMPLYDGDIEAEGMPDGAQSLIDLVNETDAILIASPEYNFSMSGVLKNAIDWVSRARPMPWRGKSVYLMAASPSAMGGIRGLWQARVPLEGCGALVFPDMFALPSANKAFDEAGNLTDEKMSQRLEKELSGFLRMAEAVIPVLGSGDRCTDAERKRRIAQALEEQSDVRSGLM